MIHLWLGPLVLLSSLTLTLSLYISSWLAIAVALLVELSQTLVLNSKQAWPTFDVVLSPHWQTSPLLLGLALGLLLFALVVAPRQPRLAEL